MQRSRAGDVRREMQEKHPHDSEKIEVYFYIAAKSSMLHSEIACINSVISQFAPRETITKHHNEIKAKHTQPQQRNR